MKNYSQGTISSGYVQHRLLGSKFFISENSVLNWKAIEKELTKSYEKGKSNTVRKAYSPLILFKMTLLQTWHGLNDYELEDNVIDRLSFNNFCGISFEEEVPDHSRVSRFRAEMSKNKT